MITIHQTIFINAPKETVWDTMLTEATYRAWTSEFCEGSYFKGNWEEGSMMHFIGPDPTDATEGGMVSKILENRRYEFISIEHLGMIVNGIEDTTSDTVKEWKGAHENYTFVERDGSTELTIDTDVPESYKDMMDAMWTKALIKLKTIAEK